MWKLDLETSVGIGLGGQWKLGLGASVETGLEGQCGNWT